jgi:hypothetical protein
MLESWPMLVVSGPGSARARRVSGAGAPKLSARSGAKGGVLTTAAMRSPRGAGVAVVGGVGGAHALAGVDLEVADDARVVGVGGERGDGDGVADGEHLGRAVEMVVEVEGAGVLAAAQLLEALAHGRGDALGGLAALGVVLAGEAGVLAQRGEAASRRRAGRSGGRRRGRARARGGGWRPAGWRGGSRASASKR